MKLGLPTLTEREVTKIVFRAMVKTDRSYIDDLFVWERNLRKYDV